MFAIFIMLISLIEFIISAWIIISIHKFHKIIIETNKEICITKNEVITAISDYRLSLRSINKQVVSFKEEQRTKKILEIINTLAAFSFLAEFKKRKSM